jgi:NAD(P)-dependent dehydrogenase (short-subunit alcohol dehydrogenase family)
MSSETAGGALAGKKVVIVGGGGLLGSRLCVEAACAGAECVIADSDVERGERAAAGVKERTGARPRVLRASIVDRASVDELIARCASELGRVDGAINCAYPRNARYGRRFEDVTYEDFCENVSLHLGGCFLFAQRMLECMKAAGGGSFVNISSIYGVVAPRFEIYDGTPMTMPVEYAAIKSAIIHLTRYLARYYKGCGIRVNAVSPGGLLAGQPQPFLEAYRAFASDKGMLQPQDVTGAILFLLSDQSRYVNGQNIVVDDSWSL